jgi:N-acetylglucosamine-6-phosphate deacetylase
MVAQVDEQHAAMVTDAMAPAGQPDRLADMALAERAACM